MFIGSILSAEVSGAPEEASEKWRMAGFAMEAAITRAMVPGADLEEVFAELIRMGMHGVTRGLRRELQRRGVAKVPRGHRPDTVANPARLTSRELDVLELVSAGLSNSAIAEELYISEKTAGHHVSAILTKLQVPSRGQAAALAVASGWVKPSSPK
jgi:DNA-binding NarL/FixJ family response regulator